jgi:hypothetical protein
MGKTGFKMAKDFDILSLGNFDKVLDKTIIGRGYAYYKDGAV